VERTLKRKLAIGAAGIAVLVGAGGTYAATNEPKKDGDAFLNDVAKRLGVSRSDLNSALQGAFFDRLDAAVADGKLSKEEADRIKKRVKENGGMPIPPFAGPGPGGPKFHHHFGGPGFGPPGPGVAGPVFGGFDAAADYLGLTEAQLRKKLVSGKSLADIAGDEGKSVDGLKQAMKDAVSKKLDEAVKDKHLTDEMRDDILQDLDKRLDDVVTAKPGVRRWHVKPDFDGAKPGFDRAPDIL
jgi:hypothetical protein